MQIQISSNELVAKSAEHLRQEARQLTALAIFLETLADEKQGGAKMPGARTGTWSSEDASPGSEPITQQESKSKDTAPSAPPPPAAPSNIRIMKAAKTLAEEKGIPLEKLAGRGTGKNGMITQADVKTVEKELRANGASAPSSKTAPDPLGGDGEEQFSPVTLADVRSALLKVVQSEGEDAARDIIAPFGVELVSQLDPSQYGAVMKRLAEREAADAGILG